MIKKSYLKMTQDNYLSQDSVFWDFHETEFRSNFKQAKYRLDFLYRLLKRNIKGGKILDVGFGDGYLLKKINDSGRYTCYGIDISEKNIRLSRQLFKEEQRNIEIRLGIIEEIPFDTQCFDTVIASEVLEHIPEKNIKLALKEVHRVLKSDGIFLLTVPAYENLKDSLCHCPKCKHTLSQMGS